MSMIFSSWIDSVTRVACRCSMHVALGLIDAGDCLVLCVMKAEGNKGAVAIRINGSSSCDAFARAKRRLRGFTDEPDKEQNVNFIL